MALPNLVLIGAPKCATTSLFHWLAGHPDVATGARKEAQFLVDPGSSIFRADANHRDHGLDGYSALFPEAPVVFDATPGYLYQETALRVVADDLTAARLLVVVRDPVERFVSAHRYYTNNQPVLDASISLSDFFERCLAGGTDLPDNEFVRDALTHGHYAQHLDRWIAACGADRLLVLRSDDLRTDPHSALARVAAFAGLDPAPLLGQVLEDHNVSYDVRSQGAQRVVAGIRNAVPKGALRNALARAYRRVNVRPDDTRADPTGPDRTVRQRLAAHYAPWNDRLHRDHGVDTSGWTAP